MKNAIDKIQSEHRDYARVLSCLSATIQKLRDYDAKRMTASGTKIRGKVAPSLDRLTDIVYYIRVFPDKFHHPKEERFLFKAIRKRRPESGEILDRLIRQHVEGEGQIDTLDAALKAYDKRYPVGLDVLETAAENFVTAQRAHMCLEEREIIPIAKALLTEADWREIDNAFAGNADPMFGENLETAFRTLHDHIVNRREAA